MALPDSRKKHWLVPALHPGAVTAADWPGPLKERFGKQRHRNGVEKDNYPSFI